MHCSTRRSVKRVFEPACKTIRHTEPRTVEGEDAILERMLARRGEGLKGLCKLRPLHGAVTGKSRRRRRGRRRARS